jgi:hypothetical protein
MVRAVMRVLRETRDTFRNDSGRGRIASRGGMREGESGKGVKET